MEIKPQDYIHLYLGCDVSNGIEVGKLVGVTESEYERGKTIALIDFGADSFIEWYAEETKPILRKLSDMTEKECDKYGIAYLNGEYTKDCFEADATYGTTFKVYGIKSLSERVIQMCKDGWDVFGLIHAGLAIDKTSLKTKSMKWLRKLFGLDVWEYGTCFANDQQPQKARRKH